MAINLRCSCGSETKLTAKRCPRCGKPFPKKGRKYKVTVRVGGEKHTKIVSNLELASDLESKLKVDIVRGEHNLVKKTAPALHQVWEKFLPWAKQHKRSWYSDQKCYGKHLEPLLGSKRLDRISTFDVEKLILSMKKGISKHGRPYAPATIKHVIVLLSRLFTLSGQWGVYDGPNPCKKVQLPKLNNQITEFLSDNQLGRLMDVLETWPCKTTAAFLKFLLYTGLRRGELFKLKWQDIDFNRQTITLRDPKGNKNQVLPLSPKALQVLREIPRKHDTQFIFYGKEGKQRTDFKGPWRRIKRAADLPSTFRLHGLRHHFASSLVSAGVDLYTVSKLLSHKDAKTTQRYAHLSDRALRDAVNLSDKLQEPTNQAEVISLEERRNG